MRTRLDRKIDDSERAERGHAPAQRTLTIGRADAPAERDADRFADGLMRDLVARPLSVQRRSAAVGPDVLGGTPVSADLHQRIMRSSGGRALPQQLRRQAEDHAGRDLSMVRVHSGREADALSESLEATAFTVGSNVFLGADAARPDTAAGDALLAHELGHVVQQMDAAPTVQRLFGKKKSGADQVRKQAAGAGSARVLTMNDLEKNLKVLEAASAKLLKHHTTGNKDTQDAAYQLKSAAERILDSLPDQQSKSSAVLGRQYPLHVKRLQRIVDECQLIWDEHLVEMTKRKAGNIYLGAGKDQGGDQALKKLTGGARAAGFADLGARPTQAPAGTPADKADAALDSAQARHDKLTGLRQRGKEAGLSAAELAAIMTFSAQDYTYINPATANSRDWMKAANPSLIDTPNKSPEQMQELGESLDKAGVTARQRLDERNKDLDTMREEGSLHTGVAMQGLLRLPVWKGKLFRGEVLTDQVFRQRFAVPPANTALPKALAAKSFAPTQQTLRRATISSASKNKNIAVGFLGIAGGKVPAPKVQVIYEMDVTNGRDIEHLSLSPVEEEVATLPGAEFSIGPAVNTMPNRQITDWAPLTVLVKCKQTK